MKPFILVFSVLLTAVLTSCSTHQYVTPSRSDKIELTLNDFEDEESLQPYFNNSVAVAVFPKSYRAASGVGASWGIGWLINNEIVEGSLKHWQLFIGAAAGIEVSKSILFFKTEEALTQFKNGSFDFSGQANAAFIQYGIKYTPAFNADIAIFAKTRGGLLLEVSIGSSHYIYKNLQ